MKIATRKALMTEAWNFSVARKPAHECRCGYGTLRIEGDFGTPRTIVEQNGVRYGLVEVRCGGSPTAMGKILFALKGGHDYAEIGYYDLREEPETAAEWLR